MGIVNQMCVFCPASSHSIACDHLSIKLICLVIWGVVHSLLDILESSAMSLYVCANLKYIYILSCALLHWWQFTSKTIRIVPKGVDSFDTLVKLWSRVSGALQETALITLHNHDPNQASQLDKSMRNCSVFRHCTAMSGWMTFKELSQSCNALCKLHW